MPIPFPLEWVIERTRDARPKQSRALSPVLAALGVTDAEAEATWPEVLDHKWFLSERLGRDVGLRVAVVDYFENIRPARRRPLAADRAQARGGLAAPVLGLEHVLYEFVEAVRGPRSFNL